MSASMRRDMPLNDVEWPKEEDYVPSEQDHYDDCGCPECEPDNNDPEDDGQNWDGPDWEPPDFENGATCLTLS